MTNIIKKILKGIQKISQVFREPQAQGKPFFMKLNPAYDKYEIGVGTYGIPKVFDWGSKLTIGKYCSIAEGVTIILGGNHRTDWASTYPFNILWEDFSNILGHPATKGDTVIGNDVWIGAKALILSGVNIGNGAVIGAGAVVAKDVPDYAIVVGNPAKLVRLRFPEEKVQALSNSCWWDLGEDNIRELVPLLMSAKVDEFLAKVKTCN